MRRLLVGAALILCQSSPSFALNGLNLIGGTARSRSLGGLGIGTAVGVDNVHKNPAMMGYGSVDEADFSTTMWSIDISSTNALTTKTADSQLKEAATPAFGLVKKVSPEMNFGMSFTTTMLGGVDYRDSLITDGFQRLFSAVQAFEFSPAVSYMAGPVNIGVGVRSMAMMMSLDYDRGLNVASGGADTGAGIGLEGGGVSLDSAYGAAVGLGYSNSGLTVGLSYKTAAEFELKHQALLASQKFTANGTTAAMHVKDDKVGVPGEWGLGLSYTMNDLTVGLDYKNILYSSAALWEDIQWQDSSVIAFGVEYRMNDTALRLGFNQGSSPLDDNAVSTIEADKKDGGLNQGGEYLLNYINTVAMPVVSKTHITLGVGHNFSSRFGVDLGIVMATKQEVEGTAFDTVAGTNAEFKIKSEVATTTFSLGTKWAL